MNESSTSLITQTIHSHGNLTSLYSLTTGVRNEIKKEIKDCLKFNENEGTICGNIWDTIETVLRGTSIALRAFIKK